MSVGRENLLTRDTWDKFTKQYLLFVLGIVDSTRPDMCDTEPLLNDLQTHFQSKRFTYPHMTKKGKEIRKPMAVARIDGSDTKQLEKFRAIGMEFGMLPQVMFVKQGTLYRYDGLFTNFENVFFMMQHLARPLVELKFEDHILDFLDTSIPNTYEGDYKNGLLAPGDLIARNFGGYVES